MAGADENPLQGAGYHADELEIGLWAGTARCSGRASRAGIARKMAHSAVPRPKGRHEARSSSALEARRPLMPCVDDLSSINSRSGYFFIVVATTIVLVAIWLVPWNLVARGSFTPGALGTSDLLFLLGPLLLLLLLLATVATRGAASLRSC